MRQLRVVRGTTQRSVTLDRCRARPTGLGIRSTWITGADAAFDLILAGKPQGEGMAVIARTSSCSSRIEDSQSIWTLVLAGPLHGGDARVVHGAEGERPVKEQAESGLLPVDEESAAAHEGVPSRASDVRPRGLRRCAFHACRHRPAGT